MRGLLIRVNGVGYRALRQLALDEDTTLQSLAIEALNDLLKKRGAKPVIANPLSFPKIISARSDDAIRTRLVW